MKNQSDIKAGGDSVDQPVRLCVAERDVPYAVGGNVVWEREPCGAAAIGGSKFCMWHHRDDYLKPEDLFPNVSRQRPLPAESDSENNNQRASG